MNDSSADRSGTRLSPLLQGAVALAGVVMVIALIIAVPLIIQEETLPEGIVILRPPSEVSALYIGADAVWTGGADGLLLFDRATTASLPLPAGAPVFGHVRAITGTGDGGVLIAHDRGIARYAGGVWDASPDDPPFGRALALAAAPDGSILAGTADGIWRHETEAWVREADLGAFGLQDCEVLMIDSRGWIWAGCADPTAGGILVRRDGAWERAGAASLPHPVVRGLVEDASGEVWAATGFASRGGAAVFDGTTVAATYTTEDGLAGGATRTVFEDSGGRMWVASEYDGVAVLRPDGSWQYLDRGCGVAGDEVKAIVEDADGRLWIGTDLGLTVADGFDRFPVRTVQP
ncbi:hypothetical protein AZH53_10105 [Methanomicrobiaceae archaeon CYW5]|uniref:ligand-binding sensor domain-containing protein n=1 Tax=Methanovulcanius yangii TaxID=1789227 RepID=UPI0029CA2243|nr:two-component regulator propeller domain-containing protein [Methanovulcanius yangii]MBT8508757.1 hypothetical protein [Methanovulcanius yangii]